MSNNMNVSQSDLWDVVNGTAGEQTRAKVHEWAASDPARQKELDQMKRMHSLMENAHFPKQSFEVLNSSSEEKSEYQESKLKHFRFSPLLAAAGIIIAMALLGYLFVSIQYSAGTNMVEVSTDIGEIKEKLLPDGSKVWLNSTSTIRYNPLDFEQNRVIELSGGAYFDVTFSEVSQFYVNTPYDLNIRVIGTRFNVNAYPSDAEFGTSLISGSIEIIVSEDIKQKPIQLQKGQKALFDSNTQSFSIIEDEFIQDDAAWIQGRLVFRQKSLNQILTSLKRQFDVDIVILDPELEEKQITATFEKEFGIAEILTILGITAGFNAEQSNGNKWYVSKK